MTGPQTADIDKVHMAKRIENGESKLTHEEIAQRAHAIYEENGRLAGRDLDNWLQAETELQDTRKRSATPRPENREAVTPARSSSIPERPLRESTPRSNS